VHYAVHRVLFRESIFSVYAVVIPVRPHSVTSSSVQTETWPALVVTLSSVQPCAAQAARAVLDSQAYIVFSHFWMFFLRKTTLEPFIWYRLPVRNFVNRIIQIIHFYLLLLGPLFCVTFYYKLAWPRTEKNLASICHAITDPSVTKIRLWASFGV